MTAAEDLSERIARPDGVRRLGQALWMMVGEPVEVAALLWARGILGPNGDSLLWSSLCAEGIVRAPEFRVNSDRLARFLCWLWAYGPEADREGRLVWTLPAQLAVLGVEADSYVRAAQELVNSAGQTLTIVSPYLEPKGMGLLHEGLVNALHRGVAVTILTHDVEDLSSLASASLKALRSDCVGLPGSVTVLTATSTQQVLLHLKAVVADENRAIIGSANVTRKGFGSNLEVGVVLGRAAATEIESVVRAAISGGVVTCSFSSKQYLPT
jgi:phosphatidylserine/phosphatidylglycerophosphate/cardiolipin synthase-like enzyme